MPSDSYEKSWKESPMTGFRRLASLRMVRGTGLAAAALFLGGCTPLKQYIHNGFKVGPNYVEPPAAVANDWIDAPNKRFRTDPDDLSKWWSVFKDPTLDALICDAYHQNLTLKEAGFRILQARAQLGIAIGEIFPQTQNMNGSFTQRAVSSQVANRQATPELFFSNWAYGFGLAWEIDFWGKFRRQIESADDRLNASIFEFDEVLVTLLGDVAANYVQLRIYEQQLVYVKANVALQKETLGIAKAQFDGGQVSELDPDQAQSTLSQTEAQVPQLEIQIRQTANRLCTLLGMPTEDLQKKIGLSAIPVAPPDVALGVPADLVRRRPDVRKNERNAAAQAAQIGVADADFYPAISVLGQVGYASQYFSKLWTSGAFTGSIGPSFQWNLLNYGRILNNVRLQDAKFLELVAHYQNSVLKANQEAEDGIVAFLRSHERSQSLADSVKAAERSVNVAIAQYKGGTVDFNRVSLLEQNLVQQQNLLAQARGEIALGLIQTYRALGGGWQIRLTDCANGGLASLGQATPGSTTPPGVEVPLPNPIPPQANPLPSPSPAPAPVPNVEAPLPKFAPPAKVIPSTIVPLPGVEVPLPTPLPPAKDVPAIPVPTPLPKSEAPQGANHPTTPSVLPAGLRTTAASMGEPTKPVEQVEQVWNARFETIEIGSTPATP